MRARRYPGRTISRYERPRIGLRRTRDSYPPPQSDGYPVNVRCPRMKLGPVSASRGSCAGWPLLRPIGAQCIGGQFAARQRRLSPQRFGRNSEKVAAGYSLAVMLQRGVISTAGCGFAENKWPVGGWSDAAYGGQSAGGKCRFGLCDSVDVVNSQRTTPHSSADIEIYERIGQKLPGR